MALRLAARPCYGVAMIRPLFHATRTVSTAVADAAGHPAAQLVVLLGCVLWWAMGGSEGSLGSALSIGSFVLTQMVLNQQRRRERALHLKIDELILSKTGARNEIVGIEQKTEEEIEEFRVEHDGRVV
jgi:low affinity Fe/Cu permease